MFIGKVFVGMSLEEAEEELKREGRSYEILVTSKENVRLPRKKGINYPKSDSFRIIGQLEEGGKIILWATEDISSTLLREKLS